ncbi:MAG: rod shape-determining protein MreD [Wenzhouxiangella sp.]
MSQRASDRALLPASLAAALVLTIMPLPEVVQPMRPHWVALVLIYWNLEGGRLRTMGSGFALGLLLDGATGSLLGQHALGLVILCYLLERFHARIRFFPPWQQAAVVMALLFNDRVVHLWVVGLAGEGWPQWSWWLSPLVSVLFWPWLFLLLDRLRRRARLRKA